MLDKLIKHPLGFWQVKNKPSKEALEKYYADKYYQQSKGARQKVYTEEEKALFQLKASQRGSLVESLIAPEKDSERISLLDVGCGEGFELAFFSEKGWDVKGLDFSSDGMQRQNPDHLEKLVTGNVYQLLEDEIKKEQGYDVVWMQNVLEHVTDPESLLRDLHCLVKPTGIAVITVPNDFSALQTTALAQNWISDPFWVALPDHLSYFDAESLKATTEANGWECKKIIADFPIDWFLANPVSNYAENKQVGQFAHHARVRLETLINQQEIADILGFWEALAKIGMGRNITAFIRPHSSGLD